MWQCLEILALHSWALRSQAFIRASRSKSVINAISWGFVPSHDFSKEFCWGTVGAGFDQRCFCD